MTSFLSLSHSLHANPHTLSLYLYLSHSPVFIWKSFQILVRFFVEKIFLFNILFWNSRFVNIFAPKNFSDFCLQFFLLTFEAKKGGKSKTFLGQWVWHIGPYSNTKDWCFKSFLEQISCCKDESKVEEVGNSVGKNSALLNIWPLPASIICFHLECTIKSLNMTTTGFEPMTSDGRSNYSVKWIVECSSLMNIRLG